MIATETETQIVELLAAGESWRVIAHEAGASRGTVQAIATGRRPKFLARQRKPIRIVSRSRDYTRCPGCGGKVKMPCLACDMKRAGQVQRAIGRLA